MFVYMTKQNYEKYDCIEKGYICNTVLHPTSLEWYYKFRSLPCLKYQDKNVRLSTEVSERDALLLLIRKPLTLKIRSQLTDVGAIVSKALYKCSKTSVLLLVSINRENSFEMFLEMSPDSLTSCTVSLALIAFFNMLLKSVESLTDAKKIMQPRQQQQ